MQRYKSCLEVTGNDNEHSIRSTLVISPRPRGHQTAGYWPQPAQIESYACGIQRRKSLLKRTTISVLQFWRWYGTLQRIFCLIRTTTVNCISTPILYQQTTSQYSKRLFNQLLSSMILLLKHRAMLRDSSSTGQRTVWLCVKQGKALQTPWPISLAPMQCLMWEKTSSLKTMTAQATPKRLTAMENVLTAT